MAKFQNAMMISKEEWAERMLDAAHCVNKDTRPPAEQLAAIAVQIQADALLEAAKIASEYHTFGGVRAGILRRAQEVADSVK